MDEVRFQTEYEQVADQLFTCLVRATGDREWAADLLQEAAFRAYRARKGFREDSAFKTWIYRIAMNVMKNQMIRQGRERRWAVEQGSQDLPSRQTPESLLSGKRTADELSRALEMLEEGYRMPFLLKHVDGMSYREIAEVLDVGEGAARVRVHRARHALANLLKGSWEDGQ
ncbi:MAG: RNA polymerase sigma factor [bacterium]|nr:RNA polymerase sigma factor [bacterium]MDT8394947.1 RNA polymerase sigma factor [bacterium]